MTSPWLLAIRPRTLSAALSPVLVGSAVAARAGGFRLGPAAAALTGALLLQIAANLANDVDDFERGADTAARQGPPRVTQSGLLSAGRVRAAEWLAFGLAALVGLYLIAVAGWPIAALGAAAIAAAWAYTGGPWPLGYHGLGDLCVFLFFGVVAVAGTTYVQTGALHSLALVAAVPVGALITAILVVNNTRDAETDRVAGKRTLAVHFGAAAGRVEYALLLGLAYLVPLLLWARAGMSPWVLLPLATLPLAARRVAEMGRAAAGPAFNALLVNTAQLQLLFGVLFAAGLLP